MESRVLPALVRYYELGGDPDQANKILADGYQGLGQMSNLLGSWLSSLESGEQASKKSSAINVKELEWVLSCFLTTDLLQKFNHR